MARVAAERNGGKNMLCERYNGTDSHSWVSLTREFVPDEVLKMAKKAVRRARS